MITRVGEEKKLSISEFKERVEGRRLWRVSAREERLKEVRTKGVRVREEGIGRIQLMIRQRKR